MDENDQCALLRKIADLEGKAETHAQRISAFHHEFRSQLHTILGYAKLIPVRSKLISNKEIADVIASSGARLVAMIDESMGMAIDRTSDLTWDEFAQEFFHAAEKSAQQSGNISMVSEVIGAPPLGFLADHFQLQRMLGHLLHCVNEHRSGTDITVKVSADCRAATFVLCVEISNCHEATCGVDDWMAGNITDCEDTIQSKFIQDCILRYGGRLFLETNGDEGNRLRLNMSFPTSDKVAQVCNERSGAPQHYPGVGKVILVVENAEFNIFLLQSLLLDAGFTVLLARSGAEAQAHMADHIDLIITDQFMERGNGWEVLRASKESVPTRPVMLISGAPPLRPEDISAQWEFSAILQKPADHQHILAMISELLQSHPHAGVSMALKAELARLTDLGLVTDIIQWAMKLKLHASSDADIQFAKSVIAAAEKLDFVGLARLSASAP